MVFKLWAAVVVAVALVVVVVAHGADDGYRKVPCYFIFGDSLADNGNNNNLPTLAKVNYSPYGIDFPFGPTGRFTNGRTTVDTIAQLLGFKFFIPPFASASYDADILVGLNYASGSAGILNDSGQQVGARIPFDMQLENHGTTVSRFTEILGTQSAANWYLNKCLYTVGLGNNDFINNYFLPQYYHSSREYTLEEFTEFLIEKYTQQLKKLYNYGARKIALFGVGQIGCTPAAISQFNATSCVEIMEEASVLFNGKLKLAVEQLNGNITDAKYIYINYYSIGADSSVLGFTNSIAGCCPVLSDGQCVPEGIPCRNRTSYAFWDSFHPTEAVNVYIGERAYKALDPSDAFPFDIQNLIELNQDFDSV